MWKKIAYLLFTLFMLICVLLASAMYYGSKIYTEYEQETIQTYKDTGDDTDMVKALLADSVYLEEPVFTYTEEVAGDDGVLLTVKAFEAIYQSDIVYYFVVHNVSVEDCQIVTSVVTDTSSDDTSEYPAVVFFGGQDTNGNTITYNVNNWTSYAFDYTDGTVTGQSARFYISVSSITDELGGEISRIKLESGTTDKYLMDTTDTEGLTAENDFITFATKALSTDDGYETTDERDAAMDEIGGIVYGDSSNTIFKDGGFYRNVIIWLVVSLVFFIFIGWYFIWRKKPGYVPSNKTYLRKSDSGSNAQKKPVNRSQNVNLSSINNAPGIEDKSDSEQK